jgi:hypothetical protein
LYAAFNEASQALISTSCFLKGRVVCPGVVIALTQIDSQQNPVMSIDSIGSTYNLGRFLGLGYGQSVLEDKTF